MKKETVFKFKLRAPKGTFSFIKVVTRKSLVTLTVNSFKVEQRHRVRGRKKLYIEKKFF